MAAISTGIVLAMGAAIIAPAFTQHQQEPSRISVMLTFNVQTVDENTSKWCNDLSSLLKERGIRSVVFVTGEVAEVNPDCVKSYPPLVDIGSQNYSYIDLRTLDDYELMLAHVKKGKEIVENAGNLNSLIFRAPYGATDDNIYSILSRSGIIADFSYVNHYNKYEGGQFVRYNLIALDASQEELQLFPIIIDDDNVRAGKVPILVNFDDVLQIDEINDSISFLSSQEDVHFINASDLIGQELTIRLEKR
jgi:peptidoglycan/xylan/chitin deacetylase (PgdA/CDA1 family)